MSRAPRLVAVVDQDDEAATQAPRRIPDPVHRAQVDLDAPSRLQDHAEAIEVGGEIGCRGRTFDSLQSALSLSRQLAVVSCRSAVTQSTETELRLRLRLMTDIDLPQPVLSHDDLVGRQRVEQFVGDQDAFERFRKRRTRGCQPLGDFAKRRGLSAACGRARFDQMQADGFVESRVIAASRARRMSAERRPLPAPASTEVRI